MGNLVDMPAIKGLQVKCVDCKLYLLKGGLMNTMVLRHLYANTWPKRMNPKIIVIFDATSAAVLRTGDLYFDVANFTGITHFFKEVL